MESDSVNLTTTTKLPVLKPGYYEQWRFIIEQYIQCIDYALWGVIENGNSFKPKTQTSKVEGTSSTTTLGPATIEEKAQKRNDVKARNAIEKRFGGNEATKKTRKNLLKQQYENFSASKDVNQKFLRSLSFEWYTHTIMWRNKADLRTLSMDDLYNNLKIYETEVKGAASSSSDTKNMAFVSSITNNSSSTNEAVNTAQGVSAASTQVNAANINNLSEAVICAFLAGQSNNPQLLNEDLEQIHEDDLKKMDLKWRMAMLTLRARRFQRKTRRNLTFKGSETAGFDKSKVECYDCHKRGHFARECRAPRNQDQRNMESTRRTIAVETASDKALVSCDGLGGYD
ncbi:ribonuclease H-like domain-containing protein [Tanacetum coccineum]